ncbi:hypothetical protein AAHC03_05312 [Spirometra sp. Aus1]
MSTPDLGGKIFAPTSSSDPNFLAKPSSKLEAVSPNNGPDNVHSVYSSGDNYYGTLFTQMSYGMGEHNQLSTSNPVASPGTSLNPNLTTALAMAALAAAATGNNTPEFSGGQPPVLATAPGPPSNAAWSYAPSYGHQSNAMLEDPCWPHEPFIAGRSRMENNGGWMEDGGSGGGEEAAANGVVHGAMPAFDTSIYAAGGAGVRTAFNPAMLPPSGQEYGTTATAMQQLLPNGAPADLYSSGGNDLLEKFNCISLHDSSGLAGGAGGSYVYPIRPDSEIHSHQPSEAVIHNQWHLSNSMNVALKNHDYLEHLPPNHLGRLQQCDLQLASVTNVPLPTEPRDMRPPIRTSRPTKTWANIAGQPPKVSLSSGPSWCNNRLLPAPQVFPSNANRPLVNNQQQSELMQSVDSPKEEGTKRLGDPEAAASLRQNHPYPPVSSNGHASQGGKGRRGLPKAPDLSLGGAVLAASMRNGGGTLNRLGRDENSDEKTETDFSEKPAATVTQQAEAHYQLLAKQINPPSFNTNPAKARFFVIKSFSEDDIHRSIKYSIWCSTEMGNKKLNAAFAELNGTAPLYLFYSVNGSGRFCGMAEMTSQVDYSMRSSVWAQDKWQGQFSVKWIFVKDVPNVALRHIHIETNDNKPVTHSRDTTEVPLDRGRQVMEILAKYNHQTSIFDDFMYYEQREQQELSRKDSSSRRR